MNTITKKTIRNVKTRTAKALNLSHLRSLKEAAVGWYPWWFIIVIIIIYSDVCLCSPSAQAGTYLPQSYLIHEEMIVTERLEHVDQLGYFIYNLCRGKDTYKLQRRDRILGKNRKSLCPLFVFTPSRCLKNYLYQENTNTHETVW